MRVEKMLKPRQVLFAVLCLLSWTYAYGQAVCPAAQSGRPLTQEEAQQQIDHAQELVKQGLRQVEAQQYQQAFVSYNQAHELACSLNDTLFQGAIEYLAASLASRLGSYEIASTINDSALKKLAFSKDDALSMRALDLKARLHFWQHQYQQSIAAYKDAIAIEVRNKYYVGESESLDGLALDYSASHQNEQALVISAAAFRVCPYVGVEKGRTFCQTTTLHIRSQAQYNLGDYDAACASAFTGLGFAQMAGVGELQDTAQGDLMRCALRTHHERIALMTGIDSVSRSQSLRAQMKDFNADIRSAYIWRNEANYDWVADRLFELGHIEEAEFVLDLFKQSQISSDNFSKTDQPITEFQFLLLGNKSAQSIATLVQKALAFAQATDAKTANHPFPANFFPVDAERELLLLGVEQDLPSPAAVRDTLLSIERDMGASPLADTVLPRSDIPALIKRLGPGTMAVYTVTLDEHVDIAVTTASGSRYFALQRDGKIISGYELQQLVDSAVAGTDQSSGEPWDDLQALHAILIAPIAQEILATAKASSDGVPTILWSMDAFMRSVPLNALYDGSRYLVEKARNVYLIPQGHADFLKLAAPGRMTMLALGKSNFTDLAMLDKVEKELDYVVKDPTVASSHGPITGWYYKNDSFTLKALEQGLAKRPSIVHLATHFVLKSGSPTDSYLALTDEADKSQTFLLTLDKFETNPSLNFSNVSLVTLSACGTGQPNTTLSMREVDSLAAMVERRGATSVLGTMWSVDDDGTEELMGDFYSRWSSHPDIGKAEALRQAQLDLLYGKVGNHPANYKASLFAQSPDHHNGALSRPYYWAPYTVTGNFR